MAFLSRAASTTPVKQPEPEGWLTSIARKLPGMIARGGGAVGGALLGGIGATPVAPASPVAIAAGSAGGTIAAEPVASGVDAIFAAAPQGSSGGEPTPIARALASRRNALLNRYRADIQE